MELRIDVEKELTSCFRLMGAVVSDDSTQPDRTSNADYWFPEDNVVAELKCMSTNYFSDRTFMEWLSRAYQNWVTKGLAPRLYTKTAKVNLANLDPRCYQEVLGFVKKRLERSFKQASKQIKATKAAQGAKAATGLLLLVNDGNFGVVPAMVETIAARCLPKYSGINTVIYFSVNMPMSAPRMDVDLLPWCIWSKSSVRPAVPDVFLNRVRECWHKHYESIVGGPIGVLSGTDDALLAMEYIKRDRASDFGRKRD